VSSRGSAALAPNGGEAGVLSAEVLSRSLLMSSMERRLKASQMAVLTTLEEEERMRLGPLQPADLQFMAEEMLGVESLPQEIAAFLLRKSEGNPLYCEEIMCFLLHQRLVVAARIGPDGSLVPEAEEADSVQELLHERVDSFRSAKPLAASAGGGRRRGTVMLAKGASLSSLESAFGSADSVAGQSHTLQRLLTAQVDSLPHEMQTVLQTASAMGDALSSKALRDVHRQLDMKPEGSRLDECLRKLRGYRYLEFALDSKTYSFRSAMLRDVLYSNLPFEKRKRVHEATARGIVAEAARGDAKEAAFLSALKHYKTAENWGQVMLLAADAAEQALSCASWEEAVSVTTQASMLLGQQTDVRSSASSSSQSSSCCCRRPACSSGSTAAPSPLSLPARQPAGWCFAARRCSLSATARRRLPAVPLGLSEWFIHYILLLHECTAPGDRHPRPRLRRGARARLRPRQADPRQAREHPRGPPRARAPPARGRPPKVGRRAPVAGSPSQQAGFGDEVTAAGAGGLSLPRAARGAGSRGARPRSRRVPQAVVSLDGPGRPELPRV